jgi:hypothetical protein
VSTYPRQIFGFCERLLQSVSQAFGEAGVTLPDRQFVYAGIQPPADFDASDAVVGGMLSVGLVAVNPGNPGATITTEQQPIAIYRHAQMRVWLWRPVARLGDDGSMSIPTPENMTADAEMVMTDASVLMGALENARERNQVTGENLPFAIGSITPVLEQGGYAGVVGNIDVALVDPGEVSPWPTA